MENYNIYPKQFRNAQIPIEKNRCFILMPFESKLDFIYGHIKLALNDNGYVCNRADEILGSKPIMNKILNEILRAQYIIADLTSSNPNVFYELGIAHTFKDAQNIILLKQKGEKIPFDITHLNHIVYEPNNIKYLTSNIIQTLDNNKYVYSFLEALQHRRLIHIIHDNVNEFVEYLQISLNECVPMVTEILINSKYELSENEVENLFTRLLFIVDNTIKTYKNEYVEWIIKIFFEIILSCSKYTITEKIVYDFLYGNFLTTYNLSETEIISFQTDLAILLSSHNTKINLSINWLVSYFKRSKSTTIDLNRYKIERYLMVTSDNKINNILIDAIFHENCYVREHIADICGEKRLFSASKSLSTQLQVEENYFTSASIIAAIGKLSDSNGADAIFKWVEWQIEDIKKSQQFFVMKHAQIALSKIDIKYNLKNSEKFGKKYGELLKDYFIL